MCVLQAILVYLLAALLVQLPEGLLPTNLPTKLASESADPKVVTLLLCSISLSLKEPEHLLKHNLK